MGSSGDSIRRLFTCASRRSGYRSYQPYRQDEHRHSQMNTVMFYYRIFRHDSRVPKNNFLIIYKLVDYVQLIIDFTFL